MTSSSRQVLCANNVTKRYVSTSETVTAVDDVQISLAEGEAVALMGPSGCGKSTLLDLLGLLLPPTSGEIFLQDKAVPSRSRERARLRNQVFGYVHQNLAVIDGLTAQANVMIPLEYAQPRPRKKEARTRADAALAAVGLGDKVRRKAGKLSGGEKQRVAIARGLVNDPAIILADEPTASLDDVSAAAVLDLLTGVRDSGRTLLIATHDPRVSEQCDRVLTMRNGRVV